MKKVVLVDMDGVMADTYTQYIKYEYEETGRKITREETKGIPETEAFPHYSKHVQEKGFFRTVPVAEGSVEVMKYLNDKYDLYIVSAATEFPNSLLDKRAWLSEYFPYISWKQIIFCGRKDPVKGDIMIDDHGKNLDPFDGEKIMFTQPHNVFVDDTNYKRVNSWEEIKNIL